MSQTPDRSSDTGSEYNWPIDISLEQSHQQYVIFEDIPNDYVKGDDITVFFTIAYDGKINPDVDRIGLTRIGCIDMKECLLFAPVQITPLSGAGAARHGTATFPSTALPDTDGEFYQFCYVDEKNNKLGTSIAFLLNCSPSDANLLSDGKNRKGDGLIAMADQDEADMLIISTQHKLVEEKLRAENRQLLDIKRRLESEQEELRVKLEALQIKGERTVQNEQEYQTLLASHRDALDQLAAKQQIEQKLLEEFEKTRLLCEEYHRDGLQQVERCRTLETAQATLIQESNQLRSQLAVTSQLTKDQATQIIDLERRLMQSNEIIKSTNQRQETSEQQARDQALTAEKRLLSLDGENKQLKREIQQLSAENERLMMTTEDQQQKIEQCQRQLEQTDAEYYAALNQVKALQKQFDEISSEQGNSATLKNTLTMLEQRCLKHRNGEIEAKKQINEQNKIIDELKRDNDDLRVRFQRAEDEYKTLYRKYIQLQQNNNFPVDIPKNNAAAAAPVRKEVGGDDLLNMLDEHMKNDTVAKPNVPEFHDVPPRQTTRDDHREIQSCPMCFYEFPRHMKIEEKQAHIDQHFS